MGARRRRPIEQYSNELRSPCRTDRRRRRFCVGSRTARALLCVSHTNKRCAANYSFLTRNFIRTTSAYTKIQTKFLWILSLFLSFHNCSSSTRPNTTRCAFYSNEIKQTTSILRLCVRAGKKIESIYGVRRKSSEIMYREEIDAQTNLFWPIRTSNAAIEDEKRATATETYYDDDEIWAKVNTSMHERTYFHVKGFLDAFTSLSLSPKTHNQPKSTIHRTLWILQQTTDTIEYTNFPSVRWAFRVLRSFPLHTPNYQL